MQVCYLSPAVKLVNVGYFLVIFTINTIKFYATFFSIYSPKNNSLIFLFLNDYTV